MGTVNRWTERAIEKQCPSHSVQIASGSWFSAQAMHLGPASRAEMGIAWEQLTALISQKKKKTAMQFSVVVTLHTQAIGMMDGNFGQYVSARLKILIRSVVRLVYLWAPKLPRHMPPK